MKIVTSSNNKEKIIISKKEWILIGKKAGWLNKKADDWRNLEEIDSEEKYEEILRWIYNARKFQTNGSFESDFMKELHDILKENSWSPRQIKEAEPQDIFEELIEIIDIEINEISGELPGDKENKLRKEFGELNEENIETPEKKENPIIEDIQKQFIDFEDCTNFSIQGIQASEAEKRANKIYDYIKIKLKELYATDQESAKFYLEQLKLAVASFKNAVEEDKKAIEEDRKKMLNKKPITTIEESAEIPIDEN